jgi:iron complex transport system ATP-binding protein
MTDTSDLRSRPLDLLSGGQRQRAWIAMTLAQDTDLLLLDEPTTYLDLAHQVEVLDLVARLNRERGRTVVMVLHDLNLAARYSDVIVVMKDGVVVAEGTPGEVFTPDMLAGTFGLDAAVLPDPRTGLPIVVPTSAAPIRHEKELVHARLRDHTSLTALAGCGDDLGQRSVPR